MHDWLVGAGPSAAARALAVAVAMHWGDADGQLSMDALNAINASLGAEEAMDADDEEYLLSFNKGRSPVRARMLCAEGYADYVGAWAESEFDVCVVDMRKLYCRLPKERVVA